MAFECPHCGFKNNEIQTGAAIAEKGVKQTCQIVDKLVWKLAASQKNNSLIFELLFQHPTQTSVFSSFFLKDLNRQLVRSEKCLLEFVDIELSIAPSTGALSTVEGCVKKAIEELSQNQAERLTQSFEVWEKVQLVISRLEGYLENREKFTISLDDPSGNSYIENLCAPLMDPKITIKLYDRTREQDIALGLTTAEQLEERDQLLAQATEKEETEEETNNDDLAHEVHTFFGNCSRCNVPCDTKMHMLGNLFFSIM